MGVYVAVGFVNGMSDVRLNVYDFSFAVLCSSGMDVVAVP
jgi:hypothetical protein